ncbi:MAG: hypothetical protein JOZ05_17605, partial [Acetobacteraceae bacterium]|nr:hypothetical protein [Acetobacteraceae bacterium]
MNIHDPRLREATRDASSPAKAEPNTSSPHRGLSVAQQLAVVLALAILAVGALLFGLPGADRRPSETEPAQEQAGFRPTPQQWAGFAFAPVKAVTFRGVDETEGKIANDDDLTTPVFSPFTGRVTRL